MLNFSPETFAQNLRPGNLCTNVRGRICAEFVSGFWAPKCAGEFCADLRGGVLRGVCGGKMFGGHLCGSAAGFFSSRDARGVFFLVDDVRGDVFGDGRGNSGPKMGAGGAGGAKKGQKGPKCPKWPKMAQNGQKGGGAQKGPKMAHFVPEWYTSGSGATAFDSTGWQKSPEYALIRIAAGPLFPPGTKVADLPKWQKSPILAPPESRRFRPGWQKSPISPPSESGASSVARSLLEKLSARLSPSSQSLHGRLLTDSRGGRARVAHVTCATVTHAHAPHSLKTPVRVYDCAHPHTPHTSHPHTPHTHPTHSRTRHPTQRHNVTTLSHGRHRRGIAHIKVLLCV